MTLISVHEARERILSHFDPVETTQLPLAQAAGRVLAADIRAADDLPPFDNSSMDGFAVIAADLADAAANTPRTLRVVDDIPAGHAPAIEIKPGQAARIMTGAPLPAGADAVVPVEETDFNDRSPGTPLPEYVQIFKPPPVGANIRKQGSDVRAGQSMLTAGHMLRPQDVGMLAMLGVALAPVYRRPRIALLSSGDELIPVEAPLSPGKIRDANSYTLAALIEESGSDVIRLGVAADQRESVQALLDQAVEQRADLILSSAGVSVGAFDFVKDVVEAHGSLNFWRVNMRPGKPLTFGEYRGVRFIGLPGNPVSAFVGFTVFVRPALEKMSGRTPLDPPRVRVRLSEPIRSDGRESYLRAIVSKEGGALTARLTGHQGSGNLLSLVQANALLILRAGVKFLAPGEEVDAWMLE
ncbi:MAG: molybdopterin molybdotransferase MoeA [Chloroflexi bacterium]|nr:molybdopterin molybdotransferase MoeA [Chloroflexota bacterium]